jgi:hypothetical protein
MRLSWRLGKAQWESSAFGSWTDLGGLLNKTWMTAENIHHKELDYNSVNQALLNRLDKISADFPGSDYVSRISKEAMGAGAQAWYSFFGADATHEATASAIRAKGFGEIPLPNFLKHVSSSFPTSLPVSPTAKLGTMASVGLAVFGLHQLVTGGLFGSMETASELDDIYSGRELVKVKKSRFWEAGGTPFGGMEGGAYFRPHAYALMMNRVREKGIWGDDEDKISPIGKFFRKNFTYDLEMMHYYDRPYPISSAAFADVPVIGGILSSLVGQFIKPPKLMHTGEWIQEGEGGGLAFGSLYEGWRREPAYSLGAPKPGIPASPYNTSHVFSEMTYQFRNLEGLTGWSKNLISEMVTGSSAIGTDQPVLRTSSEMTSWTNRFLETQQGGLFFSNEIIRRVLGKPQSGFDRQNPIMNDMPTWMPQRFKYGDPYRAVEWGEARMPGPGFAALHPELRGTSPEDYPMLYRYSILADVAPWTHELRWTREQLYQQRGAGLTSGAENQYMDEIDKQLREKYNRYTFDQTRAGAIELPGSQITQALHSIAKQGLRRFAAPVEYLIPFGFRPVQKLMGDDRSMIEQYKYERMSGTPFAFWNKPWRDWFRPSILSALNAFGFDNKPEWRKEADANQEYFDKLEFVKWMTLAQQASDHGDVRLSHQYKYMAAGTRTGINPQGNSLSIYWSMPESERAFFNSFSFAQGGEREKILNMVPEDQAHLYQAVWERMDSGDPGLWAGSPSSVDDQYLAQQFRGAQEYFDYNPRPADDWVGWNSDADIGDIRVRYLTEMGRDLHDYGEWEGSVKDAYAQEFYEGSTDFLPTGRGVGRGTLWSELKRLSGNAGSTLHTNASVQTRANIQYNDNRDSDFRKGLMDYLYGY